MPKYLAIIITIAIILLAGAGIWWFLSSQPSNTPAQDSSQTQDTPSNTETQSEESTQQGSTIIVFTNDGFEKQTYTVKAGETVMVKNSSSIVVEFSSDDHPTHRENPELNLNALQPGQETTFTPKKAGSWGIHDHEHPEFTTTVVVTQ